MQEFAKIVWNRLEHLLYFIFVKLLHLTFLDKNWAGFMQFVKFGMVGLSNTLLSYILNVMVLLILMPFSVSWIFCGKYCRICAQRTLVLLLEQPACVYGKGRRTQIDVESASEDLFILWLYRNHSQQCAVMGVDHAAWYFKIHSTGDQSAVQCSDQFCDE